MYAFNAPSFMLRELPAVYRSEVISLRQQGRSYNDILRQYPVAKSTLWRWLKAEGLVVNQSHQLTQRRRAAQQLGAAAQHQKRLRATQAIMDRAQFEIGALSQRELWLIGIALYWAEGTKQREGATVSHRVIFSNMDPRMLRTFLAWLLNGCHVDPALITFEIYLHAHASAHEARMWWARQIPHPAVAECPVRWKHHHRSPHRQNIGRDYHGLLRVVVRRSTALNRRIAGWMQGLSTRLVGSGVTGSTVAFGATSSGSNPDSPVIGAVMP